MEKPTRKGLFGKDLRDRRETRDNTLRQEATGQGRTGRRLQERKSEGTRGAERGPMPRLAFIQTEKGHHRRRALSTQVRRCDLRVKHSF